MVVVDDGGGFFKNEAVGNGGAILTSMGTVRLGNVTFSGNEGTLGDAIASLVSIVTLEGTRFDNDQTSRRRYLKKDDRKDKDSKDRYDDRHGGEGNEDYRKSPAPSAGSLGVPSMAPVVTGIGMGNLIYIADDMSPAMSFVDCDGSNQVAFCDGINVFEKGLTFLNTNCRANGLDEFSDECDDH